MLSVDGLNRIEVQLEGLPDDGGSLRLDALNMCLSEVRRTLAAVEREETDSDRATLGYRVVSLTYEIPLRGVLEPIIQRTQPELGNQVIRRFARELEEIRSGNAVIRDERSTRGIDPPALEQYERLAAQRKRVGNIRVGLEHHAALLTAEFDVQLRKLLGNIYRSRGSFRGRLEAVNIHTSPCVLHIHPVAGPSRVRCLYPKGRFPRIGEYFDHMWMCTESLSSVATIRTRMKSKRKISFRSGSVPYRQLPTP